MKKIIEKINENPYWTFLIAVYSLKDILNTKENMCISYNHNFDWIALIINVSIAFLLFFLLKKHNRIKKEMIIFNIISFVRNKRLFINSFEGLEFFRLPNESDEEIKKRLPEYGLFNDYLKEEFKIVKTLVQRELKHSTVNDIDQLLSEYYKKS